MTEDRQARLARVAEAHDQWVDENLESAPFNPETRPDSEDYNLWHVDMDADPEAQAAFFQLIDSGDSNVESSLGNDG
jgi:hypothetical protein